MNDLKILLFRVQWFKRLPWVAFLFMVAPVFLLAQIPVNPNQLDAQGKRQGKWTLSFDSEGNRTEDTAQLVYYRVIRYENDKPTGLVTEYHKNGNLKGTFYLLQDRPAVPQGKGTFYNFDGIKESEVEYDNGKKVGNAVVFYTDGSIITDSILVLNRKSLALIGANKFAEALPFAEKTYLLAKYNLARKGKPYHVVCSNLILVYARLARFEKAESLLLALVKLDEENATENPYYLSELNDLIDICGALGNYEKASTYCLQLELFTKVTKGDKHPDYIAALAKKADVQIELNQFRQALSTLEIIERAQRLEPGTKSEAYRHTLSQLVTAYEKTNKYGKAIATQHDLTKLSMDHIGYQELATLMNKLGTLHNTVGNYASSEIILKEVISLRAKHLSTSHPDYASAQADLALVYFNMGNMASAETLFQASAQILKSSLSGNEKRYCEVLNHQAALYHKLGNYVKAEVLYGEVLEVTKRTLGKNTHEYAYTLNRLGVLYLDQSNYTTAETLFLEAKELNLQVLGKKSEYASTLNNLALVYHNLGNNKEAIKMLTEAVDVQSMISGKESVSYAKMLANLADQYKILGTYTVAEKYLNEANDIYGTIYGTANPERDFALNNLASFYKFVHKPAKAEPLFNDLIRLKLKQIQTDFPALSEKEKQLYYYRNQVYITNFENFCVDYYMQKPAVAGSLFNLRLYTKGLLFNASEKMRQRILNSHDASVIAEFQSWQQKKDSLAKAYQMTVQDRQEQEFNVTRLEETANALEKKLSLQSSAMAKLADKATVTWEDVRTRLGPGEAAIEMVQTLMNINNVFEQVYVALIITSQTRQHPEMVVLKNGAELEGRYIKFYRNAIKQQLPDENSYVQFWKPVADQLTGIRKVYFSADGVYNQINLNSLFNPQTGKYLIDEMEVQMTTSIRDLVEAKPGEGRNIKNATLFGFPNYNNATNNSADSTRSLRRVPVNSMSIKKDSAQRFFNGDQITELPGTKREIETIEGLLKTKQVTFQKFMFDQATESEIKRVSNPQVLHIATHGFFLSSIPSGDGQRGMGGIESQSMNANPLLRSGLLMAGARKAFSPGLVQWGEEDGILTAYEAMSLDLDQTELVVMSACETGLGVTANGEGVYGLQRAFQIAGSKSILMSLWTVSDEATQSLMTMFYEKWLNGKTPGDAFRAAQLALREKYPQPFYWGAFVLVGN